MPQLGFDGMPRRLYPCTPSRLRAWLDCPRRYRMTYLERPMPPKGPPWAHNSFGASVHNALAGWWRLPLSERDPPAAVRLLERGWISEGYADGVQSLRQLDPAVEPVGVERTVATKTDLIAVSGRIDRLDDRQAPAGPSDAGRSLVVVDYKTGRASISEQDARGSMTMALYALAAGRVLRRPCLTVELHHVPTGQVARWEHTPESLGRHLRRAEDIAGECAAADATYASGEESGRGDEAFPATPGGWCGWCDFRAHCAEGQAAAPARRPWDSLAD
jgi:hypothetical protein